MTALSESFSLMIIHDIFPLPISTFLLFSWLRKPVLDSPHIYDIYDCTHGFAVRIICEMEVPSISNQGGHGCMEAGGHRASQLQQGSVLGLAGVGAPTQNSVFFNCT